MQPAARVSTGRRGVDEDRYAVGFAGANHLGNIDVDRGSDILVSEAPVTVFLELHHLAVDPDPDAVVVDRSDREVQVFRAGVFR